MRRTRCVNCDEEAIVISYRRDDPVLSCDKCGSYVMSMEMQEARDRYEIRTDCLILQMLRETCQLQKTLIGRLRLRFRILLGWDFPGIESILRMDKRTANYVRHLKR